MFDSQVLDVAIGLLFVYLTLSLFCSAIQEVIAASLRLRAKFLYREICALLDDETGAGMVRDFYEHPLIGTSGKYELGHRDNLPSYIPARAFALTVMHLTMQDGAKGATICDGDPSGTMKIGSSPTPKAVYRTSVNAGKLKVSLQTLVDAAYGDAVGTRVNIEEWYNHAMGGVSSAYKRRTQAVILAVGFLLAAALNADSFGIVTALSTNKLVRELLATGANQPVATRDSSNVSTSGGTAGVPKTSGLNTGNSEFPQNQVSSPRPSASEDERIHQLEMSVKGIRNSGLPLGWALRPGLGDLRGIPTSAWQIIQKLFGILLTVVVISVGAPFWFDVLNKVAVIRWAIKPTQSQPAPR